MAVIARPSLHVAFNLSVAGSVYRALRSIGRGGRAIGLIDDLSFGPIGSATPSARAEWIQNVVGIEMLEVVRRAELFWRKVIARRSAVIAWVCFDDAAEYCGFLEFVWRVGDAPFKVIDATGLELADKSNRKWTPRTLGVIAPE